MVIVENIHASYGKKEVLHWVDLAVQRGFPNLNVPKGLLSGNRYRILAKGQMVSVDETTEELTHEK